MQLSAHAAGTYIAVLLTVKVELIKLHRRRTWESAVDLHIGGAMVIMCLATLVWAAPAAPGRDRAEPGFA